MSEGFDADAIVAGLRPFQQNTVEHVVDRFYGPDGCRRFLVADETGLGKSMVARGVIARAIEHLEHDPAIERIDVLYVCSNVDLARQNLRRLNVTGGADVPMPGRLGLLAVHSGNLKHRTDNGRKPINLVSLTPGTSFEKGHQTGRRDERALLFWLLDRHLYMTRRQRTAALKLLRGQVDASRFPDDVANFIASNTDRLDLDIEKRFVAAIQRRADGTTLLDEFTDLLPERIPGVRTPTPEPDVVRSLIGRLRTALAHAGVEALEPDLIILDEFQRFTDLLDVNTEAGELAEQLFGYPNARVLLLSATPYKPLTLAGETEPGKSHQDQFLSTVDFLGKGARPGLAAEVTEQLDLFRSAIIGRTDARPAVDALEKRLLDVMCRTERPTTEARNMVDERAVLVDGITAADMLDYVALEQLSALTDARLNVDYWKSVPYFANFMDTYQLGRRLADVLASAERGADAREAVGRLTRIDPAVVRRFEPLPPGNARLRQLADDTAGWEQLLWVPPSLPYLQPGGVFADPAVASMTKKLAFSAWSSTPPAVASLLSYGADRQIAASATASADSALDLRQIGARLFGDDNSPIVPPRLDFRVRDGHAERMTALALFWPMPDLADRADPLGAARTARAAVAVGDAEAGVAARLRDRLREVAASNASEHRRQYWAWPLANEPGLAALVESLGWSEIGSALLGHDPSSGDDESPSHLDPYFREVHALTTDPTVPELVPEDLADVTAQLGMHSPANCAWRALGRLGLPSTATKEGRWLAATVLASGLRSTFNRWQSILLLDREYPHLPHWQKVLRYCADGNLQAVLDEYLFHLATDLGLQSVDDAALHDLARTAAAALARRAARYQATDPLGVDPVIRFPARFAMQYGSKSADDSFRPADIRQAFNSPFWPFVLVSTSAGQEGIDFHPWCHNVAHWNTPSNPVDFEQRDGRVNRFRGHAVRRNLVASHGAEILGSHESSPWSAAYALPKPDLDGLVPDWIYPGPHRVIRDVMPYRLSRDTRRLERIKSDVARYRLAFGQPRQEDLIALLEADGVDDEASL